ncbi:MULTISPECIES: glycosyltransferase family 39 protein [Thiorhodovibrio]|uniref:glycosyltransferase family 39 protein n=1 Tax=Thiorhodovibrio TaxID=61593 RepID=UPI001F5D9E47|nr:MULTISPECIES: glycosyltransferase family 39 protein [Thiorhodovibrio]WPL14373.1 hypothetical protein Thiosp_04216 [Thiorhodovibrio litoralis]
MKTRQQTWLWPLALIALIALWRLAIAATMPITQDEAYYLNWTHALAWGYFDHPPGVALLGLGTLWAPGSALAARLGGWLAATLTLLVLWRFFWRCGLRDGPSSPGPLTMALLLTAATLPGFAVGVLSTPDSALALAWALALHEGLAALSGQRWRWLTAGAAVGLGLLGKYGMLVIGPVFLIAILASDARALRTRWPYLGGLIALLVFSPNLLWNAHNDWLSLRFQFGHGFSTDTGPLQLASNAVLGKALIGGSLGDSQIDPLGRSGGTAGTSATPASTAAHVPVDPAAGALGVASYLGTQLAFFGFLLLPLAAAAARRVRTPSASDHDPPQSLSRQARGLLIPAALFPLLLFAVIASFSDVEPNWPVMYLPATAALLAIWLRPRPGPMLTAAAGNLLLLSLYALHAATAALPLGDAQNRILRETHGYAELAARVADLPGPVFADRYQLAAMLNFYQERHRVSQWPGLNRPSEYSRGRISPLPDPAVVKRDGFWLVSRKNHPVTIQGFSGEGIATLSDCAGQPLHVTQNPDQRAVAGQMQTAAPEQQPCVHPLHLWRIARYHASRD